MAHALQRPVFRAALSASALLCLVLAGVKAGHAVDDQAEEQAIKAGSGELKGLEDKLRATKAREKCPLYLSSIGCTAGRPSRGQVSDVPVQHSAGCQSIWRPGTGL